MRRGFMVLVATSIVALAFLAGEANSAASTDGVVALDRELNATPVDGGENVRLDWRGSLGIIEATGEPLLTDRHNIFVAADRNGAGRDACPPAPM
jgi:hypothetical protein